MSNNSTKVTIAQDSMANLKQPRARFQNSLENLQACAPQTPLQSDNNTFSSHPLLQINQNYPFGSISIGAPTTISANQSFSEISGSISVGAPGKDK